MKIRIKGNTVRFRLTISEVSAFGRGDNIEECTVFGDNKFYYKVKAGIGIQGLQASYENNTITLWVPEKDAREWADSLRVGLQNNVKANGGEFLSLLLEKDFACLDKTGEDQSDNFPNPKAEK